MELKFRRRLIKIGGSLHTSIPSDYVKQYGLKKGYDYDFILVIDDKPKAVVWEEGIINEKSSERNEGLFD